MSHDRDGLDFICHFRIKLIPPVHHQGNAIIFAPLGLSHILIVQVRLISILREWQWPKGCSARRQQSVSHIFELATALILIYSPSSFLSTQAGGRSKSTSQVRDSKTPCSAVSQGRAKNSRPNSQTKDPSCNATRSSSAISTQVYVMVSFHDHSKLSSSLSNGPQSFRFAR